MGSKQLHQCGDHLHWAISGVFVIGELDPRCSGLYSKHGWQKLTENLDQIDAYKAAENSRYNIKNPVGPAAKQQGAGNTAQKQAPKSTFKTLSDLGAE